MTEPGDKLSRAYRGLAREEPPAALDAAILAAARESARPRARNRWVGPMSIAAVLVLGLGISLRMQTEQPGIETSLPPPSASSAEYPVAGADTAAPEARAKDAQPEADKSSVRAPQRLQAQAPPPATGPKLSRALPADPTPAPESRARAENSQPPEAFAKNRLDERTAETARPQPKAFAESPAAAPAAPPMAALSDERVTELERIARLRRDGRDAEADKALEEFRRRYPDYRIPETVWERVRPR